MAKGIVVKATREGKGVTSDNVRDFTIDATKNIMKIFQEGTGTETVGPNTPVDYTDPNDPNVKTVLITHGLGYNPFFLMYATKGATHWVTSPSQFVGDDEKAVAGFDYETQNTIRMYFWRLSDFDGAPAEDVSYKYYVFLEPELSMWTS